tara:strand:+ start:621 stop:1031 length:411 start_codon:yes stop_codon:yes gene_type:complete
MSDRDFRIIDQLFKLAQDVPAIGSARFAACIVSGTSFVSYGFNQKKSHPFQAKYAKNVDAIYLHSETDAIKNALKRISPDELEKCSLYITRAKRDEENKRWLYGLAKPCIGCVAAIDDFDLKRVIYSLDVEGYKYL